MRGWNKEDKMPDHQDRGKNTGRKGINHRETEWSHEQTFKLHHPSLVRRKLECWLAKENIFRIQESEVNNEELS